MGTHEITFLVCSYLLGAVPTGFIIYYCCEKKDIRKQGSGNIGATNILRTRGKRAGIVTLLLDMLKGMVAILYGARHFDDPVLVLGGGAAAVLGHLFPVYLKFKGGKGVATYAGMLIVYQFPASVVFLAAFVPTIIATRYVSAASLVAVGATFFYLLFFNIAEVSFMAFVLVLLITSKHCGNLKRLVEGNEPKLYWKGNG